MAAVYDARPSYPGALVDAVAALAEGPRIANLGAGIGHLALPLAARGFELSAVEPARDMLTELERAARAQELRVDAVHASAEQLPFTAGHFDLVLIADALHFLDSELVGREIQRGARAAWPTRRRRLRIG
ncbi:MAG: class I SAM-dependent methyltransferase [Mesorhizobium sp.]